MAKLTRREDLLKMYVKAKIDVFEREFGNEILADTDCQEVGAIKTLRSILCVINAMENNHREFIKYVMNALDDAIEDCE